MKDVALEKIRHKRKSRAKDRVSKAIIAGELARPEACELCGATPGKIQLVSTTGKVFYRSRIFAHHWNGHDHPLDVWFICASCSSKLTERKYHNGSITKSEARRIVTGNHQEVTQ